MSTELNEIEARIIGCLVEKENTTPDYYPLTLNALTNACNQKSNRNPVVDFDEEVVEKGIESLQRKDIVYLFYGSGSRTQKYKHLFSKVFDLDHPETAILCVLLLRGAQTLGELNQRTSRIYEFSGLDEVNQTVNSLIRRDEPLIVGLPKQSGQKEGRFVHLMSGDVDVESFVYEAPKGTRTNNAELTQRVEKLEGELASLKGKFEEFQKQFE